MYRNSEMTARAGSGNNGGNLEVGGWKRQGVEYYLWFYLINHHDEGRGGLVPDPVLPMTS
ncbi:uncharacterized protein AFUA_4G04580 [Aspergillus fumigatus Af293]|uniref:Uncharacterized protein n=2 Tax=Aspergillus fumigatus TaxID=746128 RepID=Q4W9K7_ASPFU|nr:hypothetical protein AFUA_4G04580 [Aspergillus fumigatus Af293]EAL84606.1 hypothetical protein AFUA_4G04580 [Aspergillus fumigatus Af293]EDP47243.1 hypothetical protein AFUB_098430 [Aspergillus fumigatus A1163]